MALGLYSGTGFLKLPHPPIRLPILLVVENAICAAWEILRTRPRPGFDLATATEDTITFELQEALVDEVFSSGVVPGFDDEVFSIPEREAKVRSFDYGHLDKMPDLIIRLIGRPAGIRRTQDGLFVECKPIDKKHPLREHYCTKGLLRFTTGQYAWAMSTATMVGYSNADYGLSAKLTEVLNDWPTQGAKTALSPCAGSKAGPNSEIVHLSEHPRTFKYVETKRLAPNITIRHLWLRRD